MTSKILYIIIAITIFISSTISAQTIKGLHNGQIMTQGLSHLGLTVVDLEKTANFFIHTLGWKLAGEKPEYPAKFVTDGNIFITLWQVKNSNSYTAFDRKNNVGLHHLALAVASEQYLHDLHQMFKSVDGLVIEFGPELNGQGPTIHMMVREPSGNRIEFTYRP